LEPEPSDDPGWLFDETPSAKCVIAPPGFSMMENYTIAQLKKGDIYVKYPPVLRPAALMAWFGSVEQPHGPWDYKQYDPNLLRYRDLGNYHFGFIGSALGYSREMLYCAAGIVQVATGTWSLTFGAPCFTPPGFGDDPKDHAMVARGIDDFQNHRIDVCK
jgi:hypothetical protein